MKGVLVVGAGPVGLMTALELAAQGVDVSVIDARKDRGIRSKATTLWPRQLDILRRHGLAEEVIATGARLDRLTVSTPRRRLAIFDFAELEGGGFTFGSSIPQPRLERILERRLYDQGVNIQRPVTLVGVTQVPDGVHAELRSESGTLGVDAAFVVGADGVDSTVRETAGIAYDILGKTLTFAITDVAVHRLTARHDVAYYFSPHGALGLVPMGDDVYRMALGVPNGSPDLGRDGFQRALTERSGLDGVVGDLEWESHFTALFRHATTYHKQRIALAGDAAHSMSPAGGQGMNTGIQDAVNLAWRLRAGLDAPHLVPALLHSYSQERRHDTSQVMHTSELLTRFGDDGSLRSRAKRTLMSLSLSAMRPLRIRLTHRVAQLGTSYAAPRRGDLLLPAKRLRAGDLFPGALVQNPSVEWRTYTWGDAAVDRNATKHIVHHLPTPVSRSTRQRLGRVPVSITVRPDGHIDQIHPPA